MRRRTVATLFAAVFSLGASNPQAFACGFDGILGSGFSALHPRSLAVSFAISDAVAKRIVSANATAPVTRGPAGYWRAASRVKVLQRRMSAAGTGSEKSANIALLFIESQLWSRLKPQRGGYEAALHVNGPAPDDVVVVTNETVLASMLDGSLKARTAMELGVVAIEGEPSAVERVKRAIVAALENPPTAAAATTDIDVGK